MSSSQLRTRIDALRAEAAAIGAELLAHGARMDPSELFELTGDLQGAANAVEGAQLVAIAHAGAHETRVTQRGPVHIHQPLGFIDAMTSSEVSLATGLGQWAAGRKVGQAAALTSRFPKLLAKVITGALATINTAKVITACEGLDRRACAAVDTVLAETLVGIDPARVATVARKVATRIAADQVAAHAHKNRKDRAVQVTPGPDGTTDWWARIPTAASTAAWSAITDLADTYTTKDASLTPDQARADAFIDLLLTNVTVKAHITLGIPVLTGPDANAAAAAAATDAADAVGEGGNQPAAAGGVHGDCATDAPDPTRASTAETVRAPEADGPADEPTSSTCPTGADEQWVRPPIATGGTGSPDTFSLSAALISGCEIPGIGFIDADTIETLLTLVPTDIGRALLDARTGTLLESATTAYRPTRAITDFVTTRDGTCRMWGCTRPARACDLDHARPWPIGPTIPTNLGGLCRRHHRLKQRRRWSYHLAPDGTATWTSPNGLRRTTRPDFAPLPTAPTHPEPETHSTTAERPEPAPAVPVEPPPF